jgi:hypothetical protein
MYKYFCINATFRCSVLVTHTALAFNEMLYLAHCVVMARYLTDINNYSVCNNVNNYSAISYRYGRGLAMGVAIGGLAVGSALPHLINGTGGVGSNWRLLLATTSCMAAVGGVIVVGCVSTGPYAFSKAKFSVYAIGRALSNRPVALAIFGYCGHMWELYVSIIIHKLHHALYFYLVWQ